MAFDGRGMRIEGNYIVDLINHHQLGIRPRIIIILSLWQGTGGGQGFGVKLKKKKKKVQQI